MALYHPWEVSLKGDISVMYTLEDAPARLQKSKACLDDSTCYLIYRTPGDALLSKGVNQALYRVNDLGFHVQGLIDRTWDA